MNQNLKNEKRPVFRCVRCGRQLKPPAQIDIRNGYVWHGSCVPRDPAQLQRVIKRVEARSAGEDRQRHKRREPKVVITMRVPNEVNKTIQRMIQVYNRHHNPRITRSKLLRELLQKGYEHMNGAL